MDEENKVSINAGTVDELKTLDGIGNARAQSIVDYRKEHGNFKDINEVKNVKGIGDITFKKIELRITILDKKQLLGKKIMKKVETTRNIIAHKHKEELTDLKKKISLLPVNIKGAILSGEVNLLKKANDIKPSVVKIIDAAILKGKDFKAKLSTKVGNIATKSKSMIDLLRQELSIEKNTLRFKKFMSGQQKTGGKHFLIEDKDETPLTLKNNIKEKVENVKYRIINKHELVKGIKTKLVEKKNIIANKTKEEIKKIKNIIKEKMERFKELLAVDDEVLQANKEKIEALMSERDQLLNNLFGKEQYAPKHLR